MLKEFMKKVDARIIAEGEVQEKDILNMARAENIDLNIHRPKLFELLEENYNMESKVAEGYLFPDFHYSLKK